MITTADIRNRRFESAAFGYNKEDIDEFMAVLEDEVEEMERELSDKDHKIAVLAEKVREYMRDEDAIKDAILGAQKEGHRVVTDAKTRAEEIILKAQQEAEELKEAANEEFNEASERNKAAIVREKETLVAMQKEVSEFRKKLFDMYKQHLDVISSMPENFDEIEEVDEVEEVEVESTESKKTLVKAAASGAGSEEFSEDDDENISFFGE